MWNNEYQKGDNTDTFYDLDRDLICTTEKSSPLSICLTYLDMLGNLEFLIACTSTVTGPGSENHCSFPKFKYSRIN